MNVTYEQSPRASQQQTAMALEDRFEVVKDIGDGSFGSVALARVRSAGANVARRGTMVAIKTMKKTFESFTPCLELREVIFLRSLPNHPHLVPALDIFLDPFSKKLHICMECMDGNLYQLMKARDHKCLDARSVKSILYQILSGLDHIHAHHFFHRDIKPENILISTSSPNESSAFTRYSPLATPPSTPPTYSVKIADFGLARYTHSKVPYTTYVSTRWYRAPEVLLRAGEYSAPVDMWAFGAMAVEVATLKPLFPGGNEVDQVWRVCEIMGSPGNWYNKNGVKIGGGEWRDGTRLAQKLGFSFPKMAPHSMESILQPSQWPTSLSNFVTACLMWDPKNRPTSSQALNHEYFMDAADPLRPKSSSRLLGRKQSDKSFKSLSTKDPSEAPNLTSRPSWLRRSLIGRESPAPAEPEQSPRRTPITCNTTPDVVKPKARPAATKRSTWANGAPMPILPSIRPVSPLSNAVTAQASSRVARANEPANAGTTENGKSNNKKIGRQLSVNSNGNHYADIHRQEAERALNGGGGIRSPSNGQKEGFFSHLRKRARRLSGRNQAASVNDDVEANAGCGPWSNRSSMAIDSNNNATDAQGNPEFADLDKALQNVRYSLDASGNVPVQVSSQGVNNSSSKRQSLPGQTQQRPAESPSQSGGSGPISSRTRRALQMSSHPVHRYETPEEEDELLDEVLTSTTNAAQRLNQRSVVDETSNRAALVQKDHNRQPVQVPDTNRPLPNPYPTPSPSAKQDNVSFNQDLLTPSKPQKVNNQRSDKDDPARQWPTPPYDDNEWAYSAAQSIFAAGSNLR